MPIAYRTVPKKKPGTDKVKWYAAPVTQGYVTLESMAARMAAESTVTEHDVKAVLSSLQQHITQALLDGMSVRLGDLGSFHLSFKGEGVEKRSDYNITKNLQSVRVQFTKSSRMQGSFNLGKGGPKFRSVEAAEED